MYLITLKSGNTSSCLLTRAFVVSICVLVSYLQDIFLHKIKLTFQFLVIIKNFPCFSSFTTWSHSLPLPHFSLLTLLESRLSFTPTRSWCLVSDLITPPPHPNKYLKTVVVSHFMVGRWKHPQTWVNILSEAAFPYCNLTTNKTLLKM